MMKWKCKTCGCDHFTQSIIDITEYLNCSFCEGGHIKTWYKKKDEDFKVKFICEECGAEGKKIKDIASWGDK